LTYKAKDICWYCQRFGIPHEELKLKIVHRDIRTSNVSLDKDLKPKISEFDLVKLNEEDNIHISTRIIGT